MNFMSLSGMKLISAAGVGVKGGIQSRSYEEPDPTSWLHNW